MSTTIGARLIPIVAACFAGTMFFDIGTAQQNSAGSNWDGWHQVPAPSLIRYNVSGDRVVELSNISTVCQPEIHFIDFDGTVVKVDFADDGLTIKGIVLESEDGSRRYMNVDPVGFVNMVDSEWVTSGMHTLMHSNTHVLVSARACGAAGRVRAVQRSLLNVIENIDLRPPRAAA